jgi:hypothetical protein
LTKIFSLRIDDCLLERLHELAKFNARSVNGQIEWLVREAVRGHNERIKLTIQAHLEAAKELIEQGEMCADSPALKATESALEYYRNRA